MGILRLYLALCVVGVHSGPIFPWAAHDGHQAVQIFYIISGFYMQMVYIRNYATFSQFYASRFIRIFFPYWIILGITLGLSIFSTLMQWNWVWTSLVPYFSDPFSKNGSLGMLFAGVTNITIFFQDWVMFLAQDQGENLHFVENFRTSNSPLYRYLVIPQAWTVSVELTFYLLVPLLCHLRSRTMMALVFFSIAARCIAYEKLGLKYDPWEYRFFPFELALFLLGMLSQRFYEKFQKKIKRIVLKNTIEYVFAILILILFLIALSRGVVVASTYLGYHYAVLFSYFLWVFIIPILFGVFGPQKYDRFIGELSYPVYLSHLIVVSIVVAIFSKFGFPKIAVGPVCAVFSVAFAAMLYIWIFQPLEARRHLLAKKISEISFDKKSDADKKIND